MQIYFFEKFLPTNDGCTMCRQIFVTFSDIYMVKLENAIAIPLKPKIYRRYVNDMFNRRKVNTNDIVFKRLKHYHPKPQHQIKFKEILDTESIFLNGI